MEIYQDVLVNGKVVTPGVRECASRYEAIRPILARYKRPFTMLDLGAAQGYFSFRACQEFDCVAVMVEQDSRLLDTCKQNHANTVLLQKRITVEELSTLATCEHFDVVLALNVLHHFEDWQGALEAVTSLASDHLIVEIPPVDDAGACGQHAIPGLTERFRHALKIGEFPSHTSDVLRPMYDARSMVTRNQTYKRAYFDVPAGASTTVTVEADYDSIKGHFWDKGETRRWLPGINLRTYQSLDGVYPEAKTIATWIANHELPDEPHGDIRPWNFVLTGREVHLIDGGDDKAPYERSDEEDLQRVMTDLLEAA